MSVPTESDRLSLAVHRDVSPVILWDTAPAEPGSVKQKQDSLGEQFTLSNWNMLKGRRGGWDDDLITHRGDGDLIVPGAVPF